MNAWYSSQNRFISKVKKDWRKRGFKPNAGNYNILRWASKMRLQAKDKVMADSMARMVEVHAMKMIEWQTKNGSKDPDINFFDSAYDHYTLP